VRTAVDETGLCSQIEDASSKLAAAWRLAFVPFRLVADSKPLQPFQWMAGNLVFSFDVQAGKLRQKRLLPSGSLIPQDDSSGVEVALQCSGENSPDPGMKSGIGQPGARLSFAGYREESTRAGKQLICSHTDSLLNLQVDSVYEGFDGVPVVRRHSRITNNNSAAIGIEFLSSAMLHGLADPQGKQPCPSRLARERSEALSRISD